MPPWTRFSAASHRASIAGKVVDAVTTRPIQGALVTMTLTATPPVFQAWIASRAMQHGAGWAKLDERPDRTVTARDGCFRFVDLPSGAYTLSVTLPGTEGRHGTASHTFNVPGNLLTQDAQGHIVVAAPEILLPPTGVRGLIQGGDASTPIAPLPLSRVRVRGSGEIAYGDADGHFYLPYLEPGHRLLEFTASGHDAATTTMQINRGEVADLGSFVLVPSST